MVRAPPPSSRGQRRRSSSVAASALALLALLVFAGVLGSTADAAMSKKRAAKKKAAAEAKAAAANDATIAEEKPPPGEVLVTCGSAIKLEHASTGRLLGSQNIAYGGEGSGQMSVTASPTATDPASVWLVKPAMVADPSSSSPVPSCSRGQPLKSGDRVRLQHALSRRWLHSHHFPSPLSRQLEVSAFGGESESDGLDVWQLEVEGGPWKRDAKVSLKHVETGAYLSSSGSRGYGHPLSGHSEVYGSTKGGVGSAASRDSWKAGEGVFFETTKAATAK